MGSRVSAGILLYRRHGDGFEVLLAHPGGPYFASRRDGHWTIPKGEVEENEELVAVALREFEEETGFTVGSPPEDLTPLGDIVQKGGKRVIAWAAEGDLDPATARSNTFTMEWPPGSGLLAEFPEIDEIVWLTPAEARRKIKPTQIPLIDRLEVVLASQPDDYRIASQVRPSG
jgi:predicted NUDIX family NTP pyrophosphohydrolase